MTISITFPTPGDVLEQGEWYTLVAECNPRVFDHVRGTP